MQLHNVIESNLNAKYTTYLDDLKYLQELGINNSTIESKEDVTSLAKLISDMDDIHVNHVNKYEMWIASEYDSYYGWNTIPSTNITQNIKKALKAFKVLYVKIIDERVINVYSKDCVDMDKLVVSFSLMSD